MSDPGLDRERAPAPRPSQARPPMRPPSLATLRLVLIASVVLTAIHFTDNYVSYETYTPSDFITPTVVLLAWPVLTAFGVAGYLLYRGGRFAVAHAFLLVYSYTGLSSLGHFLLDSPGDLTARGLVSVLIDGTIGSIVLAVTIWSILARHGRSAPAETAS